MTMRTMHFSDSGHPLLIMSHRSSMRLSSTTCGIKQDSDVAEFWMVVLEQRCICTKIKRYGVTVQHVGYQQGFKHRYGDIQTV
jgi:hypothetical protein